VKTKTAFSVVLAVTLSRAVLLAVFAAITWAWPRGLSTPAFVAAIVALAASAGTDLLDGMLARRLDVVSRLGAYLDPLLDKAFYLLTLPTLVMLAALDDSVAHAVLLLAITVLFLLRDQWVSFLRSLGAIHGIDAKANWSGKARTLIGFPVIVAAFYFLRAPGDWPVLPWPLLLAAELAAIAINLVSIHVYTGRHWPALKSELGSARQAPQRPS
jgi:phosphatidylglycerophosphate synthase